jgi:site-specific DNA-methyltransferase (adenine-specific)
MKLLLGDCLDKLKELDDNSVDSIVTDPPYGLSFMGKKWDYDVPSQAIWEECMRVLKPGGHILSFAGSRTYHRMAVRIEDAGFEIRDQIMWIYGSGFPKSHDVGKNIEKIKVGGKANLTQVGTKKGLVATNHNDKAKSSNPSGFSYRTNQKGYSEVATDRTQVNGEIPVYEITNDYKGWGTALKPAHEPIVMARKPLIGTVADNVLEYGVGGINIDGCRIGYEDTPNPATNPKYRHEQNYKMPEKGQESKGAVSFSSSNNDVNVEGRFPANIILDEEAGKILDQQSGKSKSSPNKWEGDNNAAIYGKYEKGVRQSTFSDEGGASRYFKTIETTSGRFPANVIMDDEAGKILDEQSGTTKSSKRGAHNNKKTEHTNTYTPPNALYSDDNTYGDEGGASRFFYCPKASKSDRDEGLTTEAKVIKGRDEGQDKTAIAYKARPTERQNIHPTVKPTELMKYLIRLVTPKGGVVLDPFMGSGSTGKAAVREGMEFIGIEREEEYYEIAKQRIENETNKRKFW